jgi:exonuclease I
MCTYFSILKQRGCQRFGFEGAHDALNDVMATVNVARAFNYASHSL